MIKIGRTSAPGTNSTKDTNPIQRNMAKQTKIPTTSNKSPTTGIVNTTATYSITSSITQKISDKSSISVKTKYWGTRTPRVVLLGLPKPRSFLEKIDFMLKFYRIRSIKHNCEGKDFVADIGGFDVVQKTRNLLDSVFHV